MKTNNPTEPEVLSVVQVAAELHRSPRTIQHWITSGKIAALKLGPGTAAYVITRDEVERIKTLDAAA